MKSGMTKGLRSDNSTGYKGVSRLKNGGYLARVQRQEGRGADRKVFSLWSGTFSSPEEAARAYDEAVRRIHGSDGPRLNFPKPGEIGLDGVRRPA